MTGIQINSGTYALGKKKARVKGVLEIIFSEIGNVFRSMKHSRFDPVG
jgi:hypothetical protein